VITPAPGERVIEIPQAYSDVIGRFARQSVKDVGHLIFARGVGYGYPRWTTYDPAHDPAWGYGLLVVRDGVLHAGPTRWDTSD
jgi:hypothetical protein